jgi:hypothetical protein
MKKIATIFIATLTCAAASGQKPDSVFVSIAQDTGRLEQQQFASPYDAVFGTYEPARWLFKLDAASLLPAFMYLPGDNGQNFDETGLRLDAEYKISPAFSLNASYWLRFGEVGSWLSGGDIYFQGHQFRLEPRWYYNMSRRIQEGRSANNLSGNYFGLELTQHLRVNNSTFFNHRSAAVRFGVQRRLFRYGYFDMSYGVGVRNYSQTVYHRGLTELFADARLGVGLALARPKSTPGRKAEQCDVLQCFREENRMWKLDLFNLLRVARTNWISVSLRPAVEQKIGESPFSVEAQLRLDGSYIDATKSSTFGIGNHLQVRYYYGLKKRIAHGKSGNNLSGAYVAWQGEWFQNHTILHGKNSDGIETKHTTSVRQIHTGPLWGIQHRIFDKGFVDFNIGAGMGNQKLSSELYNHTMSDIIFINSNLRIGLAF